MRRSEHMAKRRKALKILQIVIILAITFLAGIVVTFCQKQSKPVVTDENVTTQTTSSKPKKHKKEETKKEKGKETKVSDTNKALTKNDNGTNESDRIEAAKKALDKYCKGEHITGEEAKLVDWYCKTYNISPQPESDWWKENYEYQGQNKYDDEEPEEDESTYGAKGDDYYYIPNTTTNSTSAPAESCSSQTTAAENNQSAGNGNDNQGGENYGNN